MSDITAGLKVNRSEMELVTAQYGKNAQSVEALTAKGNVLQKMIASQSDKVKALCDALTKEVKKNGESSAAAMKKQAALNKAKSELITYTKELDANNAMLDESKSAMASSSDETQSWTKFVAACDAELKVHASELKYITAARQNDATSAKMSQKAAEVLSKSIEAQSKKVKALEAALNDAREAEGDNADAVKELAIEYNNARADLANYERKAKDATDGSKDLGNAAKKAGGAAQDGSKGIGAMTVALGELIAKGIEKVVSGLIDLTSKMQEYNSDMSKLSQNARDAGVSLKVTDDAMKNLNFITGETDSNIEALSNLLQAGFRNNNMAQAVDTLAGAVIKFPDTLKIESLADSLQETLATGKSTGQFAEMLGRLGIEVEKFDHGLQRAIKTGREQKYVLDVLAKTDLPEVTKSYNALNAEQKAYADAQYELNKTTAVVAEKMMPVMTKVIEQLTNLLTEHADAVQNIIELIGTIADIILRIITVLAMIPAPVYIIIASIVATFAVISKISKAIEGVKEALKIFTGSLSPAKMQLIQITTVVLALASVLALLAMLWLMIKEGSDKAVASMERVKNIKIDPPQIEPPKIKAYAKGTLTAANGWALAGEEGPELIAFSGGERVYNARKTRSMLGGDDASEGARIGVVNIYPDARQWGELMNLLKQSKTARRELRGR